MCCRVRQLLVSNERQCGRLCKICRSTAAFSLHHRHSANVLPVVQWPRRIVSGQGPDRTRHRSPMESSSQVCCHPAHLLPSASGR